MIKFKDFNAKLQGTSLVIGVLSKNLEILNKVSRFHDHYDVLVSNQKKLIDLNLLFSKDITSFEKVRNERRNELLEKTMTVIRVMQVFASDKKKKNLQLRLDHLSPEFLHDSSDMDLIKISKKVWLIANKHGGYAMTFVNRIKSALNPENSKVNLKFEKKYGLIPEMIKNIEEANISFINSVIQYQGVVKEKENLASDMKMIFKESKKLLAKKIDKFALLFESKNPAFYKEYSQAREKQLLKIEIGFNESGDIAQEISVEPGEVKTSLPKSRRKNAPAENS